MRSWFQITAEINLRGASVSDGMRSSGRRWIRQAGVKTDGWKTVLGLYSTPSAVMFPNGSVV